MWKVGILLWMEPFQNLITSGHLSHRQLLLKSNIESSRQYLADLLSFFLDECAKGNDRFRDLGSEKLLGRIETLAGNEKLRGMMNR